MQGTDLMTLKNKTKRKRIMVCGAELNTLLFLAIPVCHIGWIAELTIKLVAKGHAEFHLIPFIGVYGLIVFAFQIFLGNPNDIAFMGRTLFKHKTKKTILLSNLLSFLFICIAVFLGELIVGNLIESLFDVKLWDYSSQLLHVTQYAGVLSTLGFGAGAFVIFQLFPFVLSWVEHHISRRTMLVFNLTLGSIIVLDTLAMLGQMIFMHEVINLMIIQI